MTAKEFLNQYKAALFRVRRCRERLEQIAASSEGTGGRADGMPRSGAISKPTETNAIRLATTKQRLERMIVEAEEIRQTVADAIERVPDPIHQELLYARYVKGLDWGGVTIRVSSLRDRPYDESYVRGRLHANALREFEKANEKNISKSY